MRDSIHISEIYQVADKPGVSLNMYIDTFSLSRAAPEAVLCGLRDAVSDYVKEHKAKEIYAAIQETVKAEVEKAMLDEVRKQAAKVMASLDIEGMAKLAAIGAAKSFGSEVGRG